MADVFNEGSSWTNGVQRNLLDPASGGITGNQIEVLIEQNKIIIQPQFEFADDPDEYAIEIDRNVLLQLINEWQELVAKKCQEITFTRHKDGSITLAGR